MHLRSALFLVLLALASPMALAQTQPASPAPRAESSTQVTEAGARAYVQFLQRLSDITNSASQSSTVLSTLSNSMTTRAGIVEHYPELQTAVGQARQILSDANTQLEALPPLPDRGVTSDMLRVSETMRRDTHTYINNMTGLLDAGADFLSAVGANDRPKIVAAYGRLSGAGAVLIDGQRMILRGRQQMLQPEQSDYHILGAMVAMYDGMSAILAADGASRRLQLNLAADSADRWGISGRAALALERQSWPRRYGNQPALATYLQLNEQAFALNDRISAFLRDCASHDVTSEERRRQMSQIAELEEDYQSLNRQQVVVLGQLTQQSH